MFILEERERLNFFTRALKKAAKIVLASISQIKYTTTNLISKKNGLTKKKRVTPFIVSLTTFPPRINRVYLTIESILHQKEKPDYVYLWLSDEEFPNKKTPANLERLKSRGLSIKFYKKNIRSYKKLIPTLIDNPSANIVTIDDDIFYPKWFLQKMIKEHKKYPKDIIAFRAHTIKIKNNKLMPYQEWMAHKKKVTRSKLLIPTGCSGIFYPRGSINKKVFDEKTFKKLCPNADDLWFKAMTLLNGRACKRVYKRNIKFIEILGSQKEALFKKNVDGGKNNIQAQKIFKKYKLIKLLK